LTWKELSVDTLSTRYNLRNIGRRLSSLKRDPWEEMASVRQGLTGPIEKLRELLGT